MDNFLIIGGDKRMKVLYETLLSKGIEASHIGNMKDLSAFSDYDYYANIILPLPVSKDGRRIFSSDSNFELTFEKLTEHLMPIQKVFGGGFHGRLKALFDNKKIEYCDIMLDEDFIEANAYLTAQGALRLLLENTEDYITGKKVLIIGFGRVAAALASVLKAVGLDVYIAARSSKQLKKASYFGYKTVKLSNIGAYICFFDYIFATVPSKVLSLYDISLIREDCVYFELASAPFSADKSDFDTQSKKHVSGAALPGKYLSTASGKLIADYILQFISAKKE
ncbi:MAG: hypothetical protein IJW86_01910 [Clostridia bacterium]|nr:hypothetical protein [Clostridia bacterium]